MVGRVCVGKKIIGSSRGGKQGVAGAQKYLNYLVAVVWVSAGVSLNVE